jgi:hypothetical protein
VHRTSLSGFHRTTKSSCVDEPASKLAWMLPWIQRKSRSSDSTEISRALKIDNSSLSPATKSLACDMKNRTSNPLLRPRVCSSAIGQCRMRTSVRLTHGDYLNERVYRQPYSTHLCSALDFVSEFEGQIRKLSQLRASKIYGESIQKRVDSR